MTRVEAVAQALYESDFNILPGYGEGWEQLGDYQKQQVYPLAQAAIEANDAWLADEHGIKLDDVIAAHWHRIETERRRAVWEGYTLPPGTTRDKRVCDCDLCSNWTYEFPEDVKRAGPLP